MPAVATPLQVLLLIPPHRGAPSDFPCLARVLAKSDQGWTSQEPQVLTGDSLSGPPARSWAASALKLFTGPILLDASIPRLPAATDLAFWLRAQREDSVLVAACPGDPPTALASLCSAIARDPGAASFGSILEAGWPAEEFRSHWKPFLAPRQGGVTLFKAMVASPPLFTPSSPPVSPRPSASLHSPSPLFRPPDPLSQPLTISLVQGPRPEGMGPCPETGTVASLLQGLGATVRVVDPEGGIPGLPSLRPEAVASRLRSQDSPVLMRVSRSTASFCAEVLSGARPKGRVLCFGPGIAHFEIREKLATCGIPLFFVEGDPEPGLLHAVRALSLGSSLSAMPGVREGVHGPFRLLAPVAHLDSLPFPTYAAWNLKTFGTASIRLGRGCDRRCLHCPDLAGNLSLRSRSPAHLARELSFLVETYRVGDLQFEDLTLDKDLASLRGYAEAISSLPWPLRWTGRVSVRSGLDEALLASLAASGCRALEVGMDGGGGADLARLHKEFTLEDASHLVKRIHASGIACWVSFSIGLPGSSDEDHQSMKAFLTGHRPLLAGVSRIGGTPLLQASGVGRNPDAFGVSLGGAGFRERWFDKGYNNHSFRRKRTQQTLRWLRQEGIVVGTP